MLVRRSFGVGGNHFVSPQGDARYNRVTSPTADAGSLPADGGVEAAYKAQLQAAEDEGGVEARAQHKQDILDDIERQSGPMNAVTGFSIEEMIYPVDTRKWVCDWVALAMKKLGQPENLGPRPLMFRP